MKQRITELQLNELAKEKRMTLRKLTKNICFDGNIGQLIEILQCYDLEMKKSERYRIDLEDVEEEWVVCVYDGKCNIIVGDIELVDALWRTVKCIL